MTNARPAESGTGAVVTMPGRRGQRSATGGRKPSNAGCPTLHVELYRHTARLYGVRVLPLLDLAGVYARQYDRALGCWTVPIQFADEVLAAAEYRQARFVTVEDVTR